MATADPVTADLGLRLQQARKTAGLSLTQVATATGISASFLSTVETGKSGISVSRLMKLVNCYHVSITDLLGEGRPSNFHVVRATDRKELTLRKERISIFTLVPDGNHAMMPVLNEYAVGGRMKDAARHEGQEFIFVLDGTLEIVIGDAPAITLSSGDSAYYDADAPHWFRNAGDCPVRFIGVATPPNI